VRTVLRVPNGEGLAFYSCHETRYRQLKLETWRGRATLPPWFTRVLPSLFGDQDRQAFVPSRGKIAQANGKPGQKNACYEFVELVVRSPQRARKYPENKEGFRSGRPMAWLERIVLGAWGEILLEQDGGNINMPGVFEWVGENPGR